MWCMLGPFFKETSSRVIKLRLIEHEKNSVSVKKIGGGGGEEGIPGLP